jgi:glutaredoxin
MELLLFILKNCPYCIEARRWCDELMNENPDYAKIKIMLIDERAEPELANSYDYYYVPTFFCGNVKLHEGAATKEKIRRVFDDYLEMTSHAAADAE